MAIYTCPECGMSIGQMTYGRRGKALVHNVMKKPDVAKADVSMCPSGHGMVKSPMCCGQDMACSV